jgi:hypothetical protein
MIALLSSAELRDYRTWRKENPDWSLPHVPGIILTEAWRSARVIEELVRLATTWEAR